MPRGCLRRGVAGTVSAPALVLALVGSVGAQSVPWARSATMAGADLALTRGVAAIEFSPANLFINDSVTFSFGSSLQGGRVVVTGAGLRDLAKIVTAAGAGDAGLLDNVPEQGLRVDAVAEAVTAKRLAEALDLPNPVGSLRMPTFGFTYKHGGLVVRHHTVMSALVSRGLVDLAVNGFNPEQIDDYSAKNTTLSGFTLTAATFAMGKRLTERLAGGFGVRYVRGRRLLTGRVFEPEIDVENEQLNASAAAIESRGGNGFGLDVGLTHQVRDRLYASFSIQNLWQRMYWSEDLWISQATLDQDDIGASDMREIIHRFRASEFDPDATTLEAYAAARPLYEEAFLPRVARAGIGWTSSSGTELQIAGAKTWGPGALIPARPDRVALGVQQPWKALRLRGGVALESEGSRQFAAGLGLELGSFGFDLGGGWTRGRGASAGLVSGFSGSLGVLLILTEEGT